MRSHQLLGLSPKEELAKRQINPLEDDDGQILRSIPSLNPATRELVQLAWRERVVNTSVYRKQGELRPCIRLVNCETHPLFSDENENNAKSTLSHVFHTPLTRAFSTRTFNSTGWGQGVQQRTPIDNRDGATQRRGT